MKFSIKQLHTIFLVFIFISGNRLSGQNTGAARQPGTDKPFDPYFVETRDTVSTHGPRSITRNLLQDKNGNYWLASWQGIICYDGKLFTNFTLKEGLIHFHVLTVFEDKTGNLWFGTVRGDLYRYDPLAKSFTLFTTKDGLADNTVLCMLEDRAGNIWFGTSSGASRWNGKSFTNFTTQDGLGSNDVNAIIQDKTGKLWFGGGGISCYDGSSFTAFTDKEGQPFRSVISLLEDKAGNIWIGSRDGLCRYDPSAGKDGKPFTGFTTNFTSYMLEDKTGNIWLSTSEHNTHYSAAQLKYNFVLYRYDARLNDSAGQTKPFTKVTEKFDAWDWQIFGLTEDKSGNIWFGTMDGVCRYDGSSFTYFW